MGLSKHFITAFFQKKRAEEQYCEPYEFCTRCDANLTLQKGFSSDYPYWICKGCGEMLINPDIPCEDNIVWICDGCGAMLNIQPGFKKKDIWRCVECGYNNKIIDSELFCSEDEYQADLLNPYRGLSDRDLLEIMNYEEVQNVGEREDIVLVRSVLDDALYIKKHLNTYDINVYQFLRDNPIKQMPKLFGVYEGDHRLVVIEEYIRGKTLSEVLNDETIDLSEAVRIAKDLTMILQKLHTLEKPIIHRDVKPSNIIISDEGIVYLLDINVAKVFKEEEAEDTKLLGTRYFAAPEQFGYGFSSSSEKADIYALGILLNVMITGEIPKIKKADGPIWKIIERCICLEPRERFTDAELLCALDQLRGGII